MQWIVWIRWPWSTRWGFYRWAETQEGAIRAIDSLPDWAYDVAEVLIRPRAVPIRPPVGE